MAAPLYVVRSYGGGAVVAQLTEEMSSGDLSFTIAPTTGWTEADSNPLGTAGPFTVVVDRFTASVEKILCSSINLVTGVVSVYNAGGFSGRGYDGTSPQAHVPGGSTAGVQTCWSSAEAFEANKAVAYMLGSAGGTQENGDVLSWESGAPVWQNPTTVTGVSLYTVGAAIYGTPPARDSGGFLLGGGVASITPSSGNWTFGFPNAFPSGLLTATVTPLSGGGNIDVVTLTLDACNNAGLAGQWFRGGSPLNSGPVFLNWDVEGF
jgi:hypothetical protein